MSGGRTCSRRTVACRSLCVRCGRLSRRPWASGGRPCVEPNTIPAAAAFVVRVGLYAGATVEASAWARSSGGWRPGRSAWPSPGAPALLCRAPAAFFCRAWSGAAAAAATLLSGAAAGQGETLLDAHLVPVTLAQAGSKYFVHRGTAWGGTQWSAAPRSATRFRRLRRTLLWLRGRGRASPSRGASRRRRRPIPAVPAAPAEQSSRAGGPGRCHRRPLCARRSPPRHRWEVHRRRPPCMPVWQRAARGARSRVRGEIFMLGTHKPPSSTFCARVARPPFSSCLARGQGLSTSAEQRSDGLIKRCASRGALPWPCLTTLSATPSVVLSARAQISEPQRGPGALARPELAPSRLAMQVAPLLVRIRARNDLFAAQRLFLATS